jgi:GT2 family glycosyltransferase
VAALQVLRNYFGTSVIYQSGQVTRASAFQQAVSAATGTYVVFLSQWVSLTPGWLSALLYSAQQLPQLGAVGALHLGPSKEVSEAGGLIFNDGLPSAYHKKMSKVNDLQKMYARRADFVSSACMLMKRQFYIEIDGFDLQVS